MGFKYFESHCKRSDEDLLGPICGQLINNATHVLPKHPSILSRFPTRLFLLLSCTYGYRSYLYMPRYRVEDANIVINHNQKYSRTAKRAVQHDERKDKEQRRRRGSSPQPRRPPSENTSSLHKICRFVARSPLNMMRCPISTKEPYCMLTQQRRPTRRRNKEILLQKSEHNAAMFKPRTLLHNSSINEFHQWEKHFGAYYQQNHIQVDNLTMQWSFLIMCIDNELAAIIHSKHPIEDVQIYNGYMDPSKPTLSNSTPSPSGSKRWQCIAPDLMTRKFTSGNSSSSCKRPTSLCSP